MQEGENIKEEISSLPGQFRYSPDRLEEIVEEMRACGVRACLLFGIPANKDACGSSAWEEYGVVQTAISRLRSLDRELYIIADVCMCEYTSHGHCGVLGDHGEVLNDETLPHLAQIALSYARAGVDMVAPSDMNALSAKRGSTFGIQRKICVFFLWAVSSGGGQCAQLWRQKSLSNGLRQRKRSHAGNAGRLGRRCRYSNGEARYGLS